MAATRRPFGQTALGDRRWRSFVVVPFILLASLLVGVAAGKSAWVGKPTLILGLAAVPVLVTMWRWPYSNVLIVLGVVTLIEQFTYSAGSRPGVFTSRLGLFASVTKGTGISLVELLLIVMVAIWIMQGALEHQWHPPRSPVARALTLFMGLVVLAVVVGLAHGGKLQVILYEVRPWAYLAVAYLLASSLLRTANSVRALLWMMVLGTGFKALQGFIMWIHVRHSPVRVEWVLAHEESFSFGLFLILTLALWVFGVKGRLRGVATTLAPLVLVTDMANARRTAWAIIGTTLLVFFGLAYHALGERRRALRRGAVIFLAISALYFPAFWNSSGLISQPARALRAEFSPDARDYSSNLYRTQEDAILIINIQRSSFLGKGFGPLIDYVLPITDISSIDPFIKFLPHNSVLDMWMRLGALGTTAFLMLLATAVVRASRLLSVKDGEFAVLGTLTICAVFAYVVLGYNDMGFFWFRVALFMGVLLGGVEAACRLAAGTGAMAPSAEAVAARPSRVAVVPR